MAVPGEPLDVELGSSALMDQVPSKLLPPPLLTNRPHTLDARNWCSRARPLAVTVQDQIVTVFRQWMALPFRQ